MTRQNFFDVLKNVQMSPIKEIQKIEHLFSGMYFEYNRNDISIEEIINNYKFLSWKYRGSFLSLNEMRNHCNIISKQYIRQSAYATFNTMFLYFEFILNSIALLGDENNYGHNIKNTIKLIKENIKIVCDKNNMTIKQIDDKIYIVEKSETITTVSELHPDIADKVIEYSRSSIKGELGRKRELLLSIHLKYDGYKSILKANQQSGLVNDINTLLNNLHIRHNNVEGDDYKELTANMSTDELEEWYDRAYDLMLLALMHASYLNYKSEIKNLKLEFKGSSI